jgi:hypothetical protein
MFLPRLILALWALTGVKASEQANEAEHVRAVPPVQDVQDQTTFATIRPSGEVRVETSAEAREVPRKQRATKNGQHASALRTDTTPDMDTGFDNAVEVKVQESHATPVAAPVNPDVKSDSLGWKDGIIAGILAHFQVQDGIIRILIAVWSIMILVWFCAWKLVGGAAELPEQPKPAPAKLGSTEIGEGGEDELDIMLRKVREAKRIGKVPDLDGATGKLSDKLRGQRAMIFEKIWADAKKEASSPEEADATASGVAQDQTSKAPSQMEKIFQEMDARLKAENEELREKFTDLSDGTTQNTD